jgi:hypothetical protein
VTGTSATLQWNASSGATNYWLAVAKVADGSTVISQAVGNVTSYNLSSLANDGTVYRWAVAAGNSAGWSSGSAWWTFTSGTAVTIPATPTLSSPANGATVTGTSATLQWNASSGATNYWLAVVNVTANSGVISLPVGNVTSYNLSSLANDGTVYRWAVAAGNSAGWSSGSAWWTFTSGTAVTIPATPTLSSPANGATVTGTSATLQWNASSGATNYWLAVAKVADGSTVISQAVGNVTSYNLSSLANNGTAYRWAVAAGNSAGWSSGSAWWTFTSGTP